jgi:hypothetical protein
LFTNLGLFVMMEWPEKKTISSGSEYPLNDNLVE